jgi:hypothetical protein
MKRAEKLKNLRYVQEDAQKEIEEANIKVAARSIQAKERIRQAEKNY